MSHIRVQMSHVELSHVKCVSAQHAFECIVNRSCSIDNVPLSIEHRHVAHVTHTHKSRCTRQTYDWGMEHICMSLVNQENASRYCIVRKVHVCMRVCIYIYICMCIYIYIYIYVYVIYIFVCIHVCMYVYIYIHGSKPLNETKFHRFLSGTSVFLN